MSPHSTAASPTQSWSGAEGWVHPHPATLCLGFSVASRELECFSSLKKPWTEKPEPWVLAPFLLLIRWATLGASETELQETKRQDWMAPRARQLGVLCMTVQL